MDPLTMLAAVAPLVVDLGKSLISRYIGTETFKPASIDDWMKMRTADMDMFKAMNETNSGSSSYPWVDAIVRLQRPAVAGIVLGAWAYMHFTFNASYDFDSVDNFAGAVGFYLFGDRTLFYSKTRATAPTK